MAYSTQEDLLKLIPLEELVEITCEEGDLPDTLVVSEAIAKADSEIDAYCGLRYKVPFEAVPVQVKSFSTALAIYHLYSRRSVAPPVRRQNYDDAMSLLRDLAVGLAVLNGPGVSPVESGLNNNSFLSEPRLFTRELLGDW